LNSPHYDICVAGGGPAGITAAIKLHRLGYDVLLITGGNRPNRPEIQSISPGVLTMIKSAGLNLELIQNSLTPLHISRVLWTEIEEEESDPAGFLVHRHEFDEALLFNAKQSGLRVMQPASLINSRYNGEGWELKLNQGGKYSTIKTNFLVDATGKKSILHAVKKRVMASTIAITGFWENTNFPQSFTQLESVSNLWLWGARMRDGVFQATVFIDPSAIPGRSRLVDRYINAIEMTQTFKDCLKGTLTGKLSAVDVTPYYHEKPVDRNFIRVGEACMGLDPLSSQGIQMAMANALQGAIVANTILSHPTRMDLAVEFYQSRQQESVQQHLRTLSKIYSAARCWRDQPFWKKRTPGGRTTLRQMVPSFANWSPATLVRISRDAIFKPVACVEKDLITSKMAILHPGLDGPLVYWNNLEIENLMEYINISKTFSDLIQYWSRIMPIEIATQLLYRLKGAGVLEAGG
jgi:flavin-dependent dehydrogenase